MITNYPTQVELEECFELRVDFRNGHETLWRKGYTKKDGRVYKEKLVECKANCKGYIQVSFKGRSVYYHTIVYILANGDTPSGLMIDHISGDTIDNQTENLRLATSKVNNGNKECHRNGKLLGCTYNKPTNKWMAQIEINDKKINLGYYHTEEEANQVYLKADKMSIEGFSPNFIQKMLRVKTKDRCTSKYRGVCWGKRDKKWRASIVINNRQIPLGYYGTELEAHTIYLKAAELVDQFVDNNQFRKLLLERKKYVV